MKGLMIVLNQSMNLEINIFGITQRMSFFFAFNKSRKQPVALKLRFLIY